MTSRRRRFRHVELGTKIFKFLKVATLPASCVPLTRAQHGTLYERSSRNPVDSQLSRKYWSSGGAPAVVQPKGPKAVWLVSHIRRTSLSRTSQDSRPIVFHAFIHFPCTDCALNTLHIKYSRYWKTFHYWWLMKARQPLCIDSQRHNTAQSNTIKMLGKTLH